MDLCYIFCWAVCSHTRERHHFIKVNGAFHLAACCHNFRERISEWGRKLSGTKRNVNRTLMHYLAVNMSVWAMSDRSASDSGGRLTTKTTIPLTPCYLFCSVLTERPLAAEITYSPMFSRFSLYPSSILFVCLPLVSFMTLEHWWWRRRGPWWGACWWALT